MGKLLFAFVFNGDPRRVRINELVSFVSQRHNFTHRLMILTVFKVRGDTL